MFQATGYLRKLNLTVAEMTETAGACKETSFAACVVPSNAPPLPDLLTQHVFSDLGNWFQPTQSSIFCQSWGWATRKGVAFRLEHNV